MVNKLIVIVIILLMVNFASAQDSLKKSENSSLWGRWESVTTENTKGSAIDIEPPNKLIYQKIIKVNYKYRIKGDTLIGEFYNDAQNKKIVDTSIIKITSDTLYRTYFRMGVVHHSKMTRAKNDNKNNNKIYGVWYWNYPSGGVAVSKFTHDGNWEFKLPLDTHPATFTTKGDTLSIKFKTEKKPYLMTFWSRKKILVLTDLIKKKQELYRKVE